MLDMGGGGGGGGAAGILFFAATVANCESSKKKKTITWTSHVFQNYLARGTTINADVFIGTCLTTSFSQRA